MKAPRLFAALPLPDLLRRRLARAAARLDEALPGVPLRAVPAENLHLTLRFFGPEAGKVDRERIEAALRRRLAEVAPPVLALSGFSVFPSPRQARIVWAGFSEPPETPAGAEGGSRLAAVQRAAEAAAREAGLDPERRRFVPHATIARLRAPSRIPEGALESPGAEGPGRGPFTPPGVELLASTLAPSGASYRRLAHIPWNCSRKE